MRAPPPGSNSFIFMQFSGNKLKTNSTFGSWRTAPGENPGSATVRGPREALYKHLTIEFFLF